MHQTDQLATVGCEITTRKSLICGFLEYVIINIDTQIVPLFFCLHFGWFALFHTRNNIEERVADERKTESWFSVDVIWAVSY